LAIRVLVVDDYVPWRRFVCSALQSCSDLQIVGEASDGMQAIEMAQELQPDLIVVDIGLPKLNGIEAARRILKLRPSSKILFLSQESSADVIQRTLATGAKGYVIKAHAGRELLLGVAAVLRGETFVGSRWPSSEKE
jgi:DNA-binding NarL/FixJ family response regulator